MRIKIITEVKENLLFTEKRRYEIKRKNYRNFNVDRFE